MTGEICRSFTEGGLSILVLMPDMCGLLDPLPDHVD